MRGKFLFALAIVAALDGCATSGTVHLKNANGEMVQCGPLTMIWATTSTGYGTVSGPAMNTAQIRDCVSDYQRQGYERIPEPISN